MEKPHLSPEPLKGLYITTAGYTIKGINVPAGFEFDGASIPRIAWATTGTPFAPKHIIAGLVHDWIYKTHLFPRKKADKIYRSLLKECGVGWYQRNKQYQCLRAFGWVAWRKRKVNNEYSTI